MPATSELVALFREEGASQVRATFLDMDAQARKAGAGFDHAGARGDSMFKSIATGAAGFLLSGGVTAAFGAITGAIGDTITKGSEFSASLSQIKATAGASDSELDQLRKLSLDLGAANDVGAVSAAGAADAIGVLAKAGVSIPDILGGAAKATLQLAAAAGPEFGVANSAELASDALNTFKDQALSSTTVVNTFVGAANASSIGLGDLKFAFSAVGAVADGAGMSFKDTATALAELGANGVKGGDAGTSLKSALLALTGASKPAKEEMLKLGLITKDGSNAFFDQHGKLKSLRDIQDLLAKSTAHLSAEQRQQALQTIFGSDGIRAITILAKEGATGFDTMSKAMERQGDAAGAAKTMNANLKGSWDSFIGTLDSLKIALFANLETPLKNLVDTGNMLAGDVLSGNWAQFKDDFLGIFGTMGRSVGHLIDLVGQDGFQGVIEGLPGVLESVGIEGRKAIAQLFGEDTAQKVQDFTDSVRVGADKAGVFLKQLGEDAGRVLAALTPAIDGAKGSWDKLVDGFSKAGTSIKPALDAVGRLAHALGMEDGGMQQNLILAKWAFVGMVDVLGAGAKVFFGIAGGALKLLIDQFALLADRATLTIKAMALAFDMNNVAKQKEYVQAVLQVAADEVNSKRDLNSGIAGAIIDATEFNKAVAASKSAVVKGVAGDLAAAAVANAPAPAPARAAAPAGDNPDVYGSSNPYGLYQAPTTTRTAGAGSPVITVHINSALGASGQIAQEVVIALRQALADADRMMNPAVY